LFLIDQNDFNYMASGELKKSAGKINIELLLGISATILSLVALIVSIFQTKIARDQQHAAVWPYLQTYSANADKSFEWGIENKGIGPALVRKVEFTYDTISYEGPREFLWGRIGMNIKGTGFGWISDKSVFKPGEIMSLINVWENDSIEQELTKNLNTKLFNLRVIYSDVYGNCWQLDQGKTTELSDCPD